MSVELAIGGLRLAVTPPPGFELIEEDPLYGEFLTPPGTGGAPDLPVELAPEPAPEPDLPLLFDTEESWALYGGGERLVFRLRGPGGEADALWTAAITLGKDGAPRQVRVACGPRLVSGRRLTNPVRYPLDQLLLGLALAPRRGVVCHAAGLLAGDPADGRGALCGGPSGAGKTTLMRLAAAHRSGLLGLSDDRLVLRLEASEPRLHGTPWAGEGRIARNLSGPLSALVFLRHAPANELRPLAPREAFERLLPIVSVPWYHPPAAERALDLASSLAETLPAHELHFRPEPAALDQLDRLFTELG